MEHNAEKAHGPTAAALAACSIRERS
jgi:hypothetical protein